MATLGSIIMENATLAEVRSIIQETDFAFPAHRTIYRAMVEWMETHQPGSLDLVALRDTLDRQKNLDQVGGADYLVALVEGLPNAANAGHYAKTVREKAIVRLLVETCAKIIHNATMLPYEKLDDLVGDAHAQMRNVMARLPDNKLKPIKEILSGVYTQMTDPAAAKAAIMPTGIASLDDALVGFRPGYYVLAARAKMGKTSLAMNILEHTAVAMNVPSAMITLESTPEEVLQDLIYSRAKVDSKKGRMGKLTEEEHQKIVLAAGEVMEAPLYILAAKNPNEVIGTLQRLYHEKGIQVAVTDYLQRAVRDTEKENQEIAQFSTNLANLAQQELRIRILALAQVVKEVDKRDDKRPKPGDIYGPGSIMHDADAAMLLFRPDFYEPNELAKRPAELEIIQRKGSAGKVQLNWEAMYRRFSDYNGKKP